ncbi:hypothetical protein GCM10010038_06700 [Glutamicibacter protophormiae]|nr:hypothetical protein GCM10010038_06700 [Glutamicibacter protophormiae]
MAPGDQREKQVCAVSQPSISGAKAGGGHPVSGSMDLQVISLPRGGLKFRLSPSNWIMYEMGK